MPDPVTPEMIELAQSILAKMEIVREEIAEIIVIMDRMINTASEAETKIASRPHYE